MYNNNIIIYSVYVYRYSIHSVYMFTCGLLDACITPLKAVATLFCFSSNHSSFSKSRACTNWMDVFVALLDDLPIYIHDIYDIYI